jgi:hypothetical protein
MQAFRGEEEVAADSSTGSDPQFLDLSGPTITRVVLAGGEGNGRILLLVSWKRLERPVCFYWGDLTLEPNAELGLWSTYLVVQNLNITPSEVDPLIAAQTIGGIISSANLVAAGRRIEIPDLEFCALDAPPYGNFRVR